MMTTADEGTPKRKATVLQRIEGKYQRTASRLLHRRQVQLQLKTPLLSFTFDDFPVSALHTGGEILRSHGYRGTYYVSLGLRGSVAPTGQMFSQADVITAHEHGHELGCHTYGHMHSWNTGAGPYAESLQRNARALSEVIPGARFKTFSYPIAEPHPHNKRLASRLFRGCRGGGQTNNVGSVDLALLRSFFLEKTRGDLQPVYQLIDKNREDTGWLIISTHDVCEGHTEYGCTPGFFEAVVRHAAASGAAILPVADALDLIVGP